MSGTRKGVKEREIERERERERERDEAVLFLVRWQLLWVGSGSRRTPATASYHFRWDRLSSWWLHFPWLESCCGRCCCCSERPSVVFVKCRASAGQVRTRTGAHGHCPYSVVCCCCCCCCCCETRGSSGGGLSVSLSRCLLLSIAHRVAFDRFRGKRPSQQAPESRTVRCRMAAAIVGDGGKKNARPCGRHQTQSQTLTKEAQSANGCCRYVD